MLITLAQWLQVHAPDTFGFLRVVQYLTFRAVMAAMTALLIGLAFGPWVIRRLASLKIGQSRVMASDGRNTGNPEFKGFALSVNAKDEADADRLFNSLSAGGKVMMPLGKTFFSPRFGMATDKFGVNWMVIVEH